MQRGMDDKQSHLERILIVDDNPENIKTLGAILMEEGFLLSVAQSGKEALISVEKNAPNLILLDINMPGMNGIEVCKELKKEPLNTKIPIIFLTAYTDEEHKQAAFSSGGVDYITKPFHKEEVLARVKTHLQIESYRNYLEQEVEKRTNELKIANEQLKNEIIKTKQAEEALIQAQKMEIVGTLAGGLAHDFNNALTGILGVTSIIQRRIQANKTMGNDFLKNRLDIIQRSASMSANMVSQLLTLSGKHDVSFSPVDLNLSVKHVIKIAENSFDKTVELIPEYLAKEAIVSADPMQIEQVLLNLCVNAEHAMTVMRKKGERQGGRLTVSIEQYEANESFCSNHPSAVMQDYWCIRVKDTGVGIPKDITNKIFNPFFTTKRVGKGTGLGLAMVYNIVNAHNGVIEVHSTPGEGTEVNVFLPLFMHSQLLEYGAEEDRLQFKGEGLILIIDDEEVVRLTAKSIFEDCGYQVMMAENGQEGVNKYKEKHQDIKAVLLDANMPVMTGKETYLKLKEINPDIKVLLVSGSRFDSRVEEIIDLGATDFVEKPYTLGRLAEKMCELNTV